MEGCVICTTTWIILLGRLIWSFVCSCNILLRLTWRCCCLTHWSLLEFLKTWKRGKWQKRECINTLIVLVTPPPCQTKKKKYYIISTEIVVSLVLGLGTSKKKKKNCHFLHSELSPQIKMCFLWFFFTFSKQMFTFKTVCLNCYFGNLLNT